MGARPKARAYAVRRRGARVADDAPRKRIGARSNAAPRGRDPRVDPQPLARVPTLVMEGARLYNEGHYWHAHEAWEEAWHALRAKRLAGAATFLQGLILAAAAFENLRRGKPTGFRRQMAQALHQLRTARSSAGELGVRAPDAFVEALLDLYLEAARRPKLAGWSDLAGAPPRLEVTSNP